MNNTLKVFGVSKQIFYRKRKVNYFVIIIVNTNSRTRMMSNLIDTEDDRMNCNNSRCERKREVDVMKI